MLTIEKENEISDCQKKLSKHFSQLIEKLNFLQLIKKLTFLIVDKEADISDS